jgi:ParB family chromosome partitioning protein
MTAKRGLGRGLDSLIPPSIDAKHDPTAKQDEAVSRTKDLFISDIKPNPGQPRKIFREQELSDLAESIKTHGVLQPIVVIKSTYGYTLVAGERRLRAAKRAGLKTIPTIVRTLDDQAQLEVSLIENIQRDDLSPLELATALAKLNQQFNIRFEELAKRLGKGTSTINNTVRLLQLPAPARQALASGKISEGHARQILALAGQAKLQQQLLDSIVRHGWSVRRAEQFVLESKNGVTERSAPSQSAFAQTKQTQKLAKRLKTDVALQPMAKGGRLVIRYKNQKDLDRISRIIGD